MSDLNYDIDQIIDKRSDKLPIEDAYLEFLEILVLFLFIL